MGFIDVGGVEVGWVEKAMEESNSVGVFVLEAMAPA